MSDYDITKPEEVRGELLSTPGAGVCPQPGCNVIIQGGKAGEDSHLLTVHGIMRDAR